MKKVKAGTSYDKYLIEKLCGNEAAQREYIKAAFEENPDMPQAILTALRIVAEARGFKNFAEEADLNRVSLYRTLSKTGNPKLETLYRLLDILGLQLAVEEKKQKFRVG